MQTEFNTYSWIHGQYDLSEELQQPDAIARIDTAYSIVELPCFWSENEDETFFQQGHEAERTIQEMADYWNANPNNSAHDVVLWFIKTYSC